MNKASIFVLLLGISYVSNAQQNSDIWVGRLVLSQKHPITELVQITDTDSYTNQPIFFNNTQLYYTQSVAQEAEKTAVAPEILETSEIMETSETIETPETIDTEGVEHSEEAQTQMDVFMFDLVLGTNTNLTQSKSSEYSPMPVPNKPGFASVIRVNSEKKQELWTITPQGSKDKHLVPLIEPVGYQVWLNKHELLLFVLGKPNTLQRVDTRVADKQGVIIDNKIGASLHRFKDSKWVLYTRMDEDNFLHSYNMVTGKTEQLLVMPKNSEYFTISSQGDIFTSDGDKLWRRTLSIKDERVVSAYSWQELKIKQMPCTKGVTRMALSPDSSMIALVCPRESL